MNNSLNPITGLVERQTLSTEIRKLDDAMGDEDEEDGKDEEVSAANLSHDSDVLAIAKK